MSVALRDDRGEGLGYLSMALGWDPARRRWFGGPRAEIDLNAAALLFAGERLVDVVYHEQLASADGSVRHHGDSLTGEGKGDNEIITIDLTRLPGGITCVLFLVTSYTGQQLAQVDNAFCRLVDAATGTELVRYDLSESISSGLVMGVVFPTGEGWCFEEIVEGIDARHPLDALPALSRHLR
ncbi:TerD family protein [Nocardia sp. ET3-3]|uniref:TerD family protein n=1 Tax=Nocardia terrae TaxID=2675851 RepID=A0A7K1V1C3_9NOCA|nr:TerD family protein [Nocardia terrae]